jgi:beta-glucosidase
MVSILEAWYPGEQGGRAVAETLFGDNNPAGRLPVSFPRSVGQLPVFYDHFPSKGKGYVDGTDAPEFVFGHGLSYTTFKYANLAIAAPDRGSKEDVVVKFNLTNTGKREGDEVAQVYVRQETASVATPVKALKAFTRIHLMPGETKPVVLRVRQADLAVWDANQEWKVEPATYTVSVGGSSAAETSGTFRLEK